MKQASVLTELQTPALGVVNPYALAETIVGHPIDWAKQGNAPRLLEEIFQTPYAKLFDPAFGSPLYTGFEVESSTRLRPIYPEILDWKEKERENDLEELFLADIQTLGDLKAYLKVDSLDKVRVEQAEQLREGLFCLTLKEPKHIRNRQLKAVLSEAVVRTFYHDRDRLGKSKDWDPPSGSWGLRGRFFNKTAEYFDPIQGNVANCYFIAALSAVAWAQPFLIQHITRATGQSQDAFNNLIKFYKPDSNGQIDREIEVSSEVPLTSANNFIYARSSETDEIWPAIYEKAFAKLVTNTTSDQPDITATGWGDCVRATAQLNGGKRHYYGTDGRTGYELYQLVRANSLSKRTIHPMTAWTYSSGTATDKKLVYSDANVVASHCYTVLGWEYRNNKRYIVLRNPWGNTEASVQTLDATIYLKDISWWRPINLSVVDGTFAIEADAFQKYFAGLGVAK